MDASYCGDDGNIVAVAYLETLSTVDLGHPSWRWDFDERHRTDSKMFGRYANSIWQHICRDLADYLGLRDA
jgi:hypothetical protein